MLHSSSEFESQVWVVVRLGLVHFGHPYSFMRIEHRYVRLTADLNETMISEAGQFRWSLADDFLKEFPVASSRLNKNLVQDAGSRLQTEHSKCGVLPFAVLLFTGVGSMVGAQHVYCPVDQTRQQCRVVLGGSERRVYLVNRIIGPDQILS